MSYATIQDLLVNHLKTLVVLPTLQEENTRNIGKTGVSFSRATMLHTRPQQASVGINGKDAFSGLFQIDLFVPIDSGTADVNTLADTVVEHFPRGLTLTLGNVYVHIQLAWRETGSRFETFYNCPVVIQWQCIV